MTEKPITPEMIEEFFNSFEEENKNLTLREKLIKLEEYRSDFRVESPVYWMYSEKLKEETTKNIIKLLKGFTAEMAHSSLREVIEQVNRVQDKLIL